MPDNKSFVWGIGSCFFNVLWLSYKMNFVLRKIQKKTHRTYRTECFLYKYVFQYVYYSLLFVFLYWSSLFFLCSFLFRPRCPYSLSSKLLIRNKRESICVNLKIQHYTKCRHHLMQLYFLVFETKAKDTPHSACLMPELPEVHRYSLNINTLWAGESGPQYSRVDVLSPYKNPFPAISCVTNVVLFKQCRGPFTVSSRVQGKELILKFITSIKTTSLCFNHGLVNSCFIIRSSCRWANGFFKKKWSIIQWEHVLQFLEKMSLGVFCSLPPLYCIPITID